MPHCARCKTEENIYAVAILWAEDGEEQHFRCGEYPHFCLPCLAIAKKNHPEYRYEIRRGSKIDAEGIARIIQDNADEGFFPLNLHEEKTRD